MTRRAPSAGLAVVATLAIGAAALFACTSADDRPDEVTSTPGAPGPQVAAPGTPTGAPTNGGCEDFGALAGESLDAWFEKDGASVLQGTAFGIAGRPSITRVRIVAAGEEASLEGKTSVLGAGDNASVATCTHCLFLAVGCASLDDCSTATWFYPRAGKATVTSAASGPGQTFAGSFADVELEQVTIDPVSFAKQPVPGGACVRVPSLTFSSTTPGDGSSGSTSTDAGGDGDGGSRSGSSGGAGKYNSR